MNKATKKKFATPAQYLKYLKMSGDGKKQYLPAIDINVLSMDKDYVLMTDDGPNQVSKTVIYIDGADIDIIAYNDMIVISGVKKPIKRFTAYRDGKGVVKLWEVRI